MKSQSHIVYYKNHQIIYFNGVYTIKDQPSVGYLRFIDAAKEIDKVENALNNNIEQFFDNLKSNYGKKPDSER